MQFPRFQFLKVVQKHQLGEVGNQHLLTAYFLSNISAENCFKSFNATSSYG